MRTETRPESPVPSSAPAQPVGRPGAALIASSRAEWLRLRKWPAVWVLVGTWLLLNLTFGYVFNYIAYATDSANFASEGVPPEALLADILPAAVPDIFANGMPMFGGAIVMILGALASGSGYGWGTWKTVLTQGPGRLAAFGGTLAAVAGMVLVVIAATLAVDLGASLLIAAVESQPITWPAWGELALSVGGGTLIMTMWAAAGVLIGVLTRSPAVAIGLGLVWSLVVENLLRGVSGLLDAMSYVTDVMPGTASGSVAGALGQATQADDGGAPGVQTILDGSTAAIVVTVYIVVFTVAAAILMRRRDLA